jgi:hypothetical protein
MNETDEQELMARAEGARREATEDVRGKAEGGRSGELLRAVC